MSGINLLKNYKTFLLIVATFAMRPNYWSDFLICFVADSKLRYTFLVDSRNLMGQIDTLANLQSQILILLVFDDPMEKVNALVQFYQFLDETKSYDTFGLPLNRGVSLN